MIGGMNGILNFFYFIVGAWYDIIGLSPVGSMIFLNNHV
jgi:hypothetical protein